jgi:serine/threonine protein kinase
VDRHAGLDVPDPDPGIFLSRGYQGLVFVRGTGADRRVIKQAMGGRIARWLRESMLRREYAAYGRVVGIPGIPRCFGLQDDGSLVLEYMAGEAYRETVPALKDRARFFKQLKEQILALHAAGVAHADLKRRGNLLISPDGDPILLDFGSAVLRDPGGGWWNRFLFRQACRMDLNAWVKRKYRRRYDLLTPEDQQHYQPTALEDIARVIRRGWRKVTGRRFRKAWRQKRRDQKRQV